jgi:hypothetical protein
MVKPILSALRRLRSRQAGTKKIRYQILRSLRFARARTKAARSKKPGTIRKMRASGVSNPDGVA